jgi:hypothetical protein
MRKKAARSHVPGFLILGGSYHLITIVWQKRSNSMQKAAPCLIEAGGWIYEEEILFQ